MNRFLYIVIATIILAGCSQSNSGDSASAPPGNVATPPESPIGPPPPTEAAGTGGTIVGNGGGDIPLQFTLFGLKGFDYWSSKVTKSRKNYEKCGQLLKAEEDPVNPWTETEWQALLAKKCGLEPLPRIGYFESIEKALRVTKLFLSDSLTCTGATFCGRGWQSFPEEMKIYISPAKWSLLSQQEKVSESLLAYDSLNIGSHKNLIDRNLELEIFRQVFQVNFSMDVFRNFIDERKLTIVEDGAQVYAQDKIVAQMSLVMDCLRLVEKKYPNQTNINHISLIEKNYQYSSAEEKASAKVEFDYQRFYIGFEDAVRSTEKTFYLGQSSSLQKCYNSIVPMGLKNPLLDIVSTNPIIQKPSLKPPMTGDSDLVLEFINIAFKALDFIIQDQNNAENRYQQCLKDNVATGSQTCQAPALKSTELDIISDVFHTIEILETDNKLCTSNLPNCSDQDAVVAINRPADRQIVFNRAKWKALGVADKIQLALHEVFGIVGLESNNYHLSSFFAPLIYIESFSVDFFADEIKNFLEARKIFALHVGDNYEHIQYQDRAIVLMDCLNLVEQRFPGRLDIGMVSLHKKNGYSWSGLEIEKNGVLRILGLSYTSPSNVHKDFRHLFEVGRNVLYLDANTTLQQCYNKVVALGLKN